MKYLHIVKLHKTLTKIKEENELLTFEETQWLNKNLEEFKDIFEYYTHVMETYNVEYNTYSDERVAIFKGYSKGEEETPDGIAIKVEDSEGLEEDLKLHNEKYKDVLDKEKKKREILNEFLDKPFDGKVHKIHADNLINISSEFTFWDFSSYMNYLIEDEFNSEIEVTKNLLVSLYDKLGKTKYPLEGVIKYYTFLNSSVNVIKTLLKDIKVNDKWVGLEEGYMKLLMQKGMQPSVKDDMIEFNIDNEKLEEVQLDIKEFEEDNKDDLLDYKESVSNLMERLSEKITLSCSKDIHEMLSKELN